LVRIKGRSKSIKASVGKQIAPVTQEERQERGKGKGGRKRKKTMLSLGGRLAKGGGKKKYGPIWGNHSKKTIRPGAGQRRKTLQKKGGCATRPGILKQVH